MESKSRSGFSPSLKGRMTVMFAALAIIIEGLFLTYWAFILAPRLELEIESNVRSLAQSQAIKLADLLSEKQIDKDKITRLMDSLLLLKDPFSETPLVLALELEMDYDIIQSTRGAFDLIRRHIPETADHEDLCYEVEVPLFSNDTKELLGIARFHGSKAFFLRVKKDVKRGFFLGTACIFFLLFFSWWLVIILLRPLNTLVDNLRLRGGNVTEALPPLKGAVSEEIQLVKTALDDLFSRIHEYISDLSSINEELERRVSKRTIQLQAANKELEAFSYSVSHDLRAPLRHIDGFSLALLEDFFDQLDEDGKDYIKRIRRGCSRMSDLIDAMLVLSRVGRKEIVPESVDLSHLAQKIAEELKHQQPQRQAQFAIPPGIAAQGDSGLLQILLENLMGNAWKFSALQEITEIEFNVQNGPVSKANEKNERVYFVRDNGVGFDMTYSNKLFVAFQRLHTESEFAGTGIGLATVQRIINRHNGRIWAEGEVGKGAVFYFTLGLADLRFESRYGETDDGK